METCQDSKCNIQGAHPFTAKQDANWYLAKKAPEGEREKTSSRQQSQLTANAVAKLFSITSNGALIALSSSSYGEFPEGHAGEGQVQPELRWITR